MSAAVKKVTVNLPAELLDEAQSVTDRGITDTIVEGLRELTRRRKREALRALRGKVTFALDLGVTRR